MIKSVTNISQLTKFLSSFDVEEVHVDKYQTRNKGLKVVQDEALEVRADSHEIKLKSGGTVKYKKLCLCHGARPKLICPPSSSSDDAVNDYILGIRDTESVETFQKKLANARR